MFSAIVTLIAFLAPRVRAARTVTSDLYTGDYYSGWTILDGGMTLVAHGADGRGGWAVDTFSWREGEWIWTLSALRIGSDFGREQETAMDNHT